MGTESSMKKKEDGLTFITNLIPAAIAWIFSTARHGWHPNLISGSCMSNILAKTQICCKAKIIPTIPNISFQTWGINLLLGGLVNLLLVYCWVSNHRIPVSDTTVESFREFLQLQELESSSVNCVIIQYTTIYMCQSIKTVVRSWGVSPFF